MASRSGLDSDGIQAPLRPASQQALPRGAPSFLTSAPVADDFTSVKFETKGWRSMFPDLPDNDGRSCYGRFKFVIWSAVVIALVAGAIGLSIAMVVVHQNRTDGDPEPYKPPGTTPDSGPSADKSPSPTPPPNTDKDGQLEVMQNPPFNVPGGWTALWWDEFDGTSLNMKNWNYDYGYGKDYGLWAWGNQEQQYYQPENVKVANGLLTITAQEQVTELPDGFKFNYTSGRINSKGKVGFYGGMKTSDGRTWSTIRIEASLKAPQKTPTGLWAAYWLLPTDMRYGVWASSGEIDIYEMKNDFAKCNFALHYGGPWPKYNRRYNKYEARPGGGSFSNDFTQVALEWTKTKLTMSMEGEEVLSMDSRSVNPDGFYSDAIGAGDGAPFDIPFYIIMNLSVGGRYPGNATEATVLPNTFSMDYVRVFGQA